MISYMGVSSYNNNSLKTLIMKDNESTEIKYNDIITKNIKNKSNLMISQLLPNVFMLE